MDHKRSFGYCVIMCCVVVFIGLNLGPGHLHSSMLKYLVKTNLTILRTVNTNEVAYKVKTTFPMIHTHGNNNTNKAMNKTSEVTSTQTIRKSTNTGKKTTPKYSTTTVSVPIVNTKSHNATKPVRSTNVTDIRNISRNASSPRDAVVMPTLKPPTDIAPLEPANYSICTVFIGGLGNHMFMFATIFGLAAKKGMSVSVGKTDYLTKIFKLDLKLKDNNGGICKTYVGRGERLGCGYDEKMASFPPNNNYRLGTYLQSWKYFYNASVALRKQFRFQDDTVEKKNKVIDLVLKKHNLTSRSNVTLIGVHVRRGDLVNHRFGYMVASEDYLKKAVDYFKSKGYTNPLFIICSNDMKWTKTHMPKEIRSEYIEGNSAAVDMAVLGSCDHMISTVGTFSWWSAWLTGGEVTFYQWPAKEGSGLRRQFSKDYKDFFYPGWVGFS
ncbi:galactoside 2-alpha-L-fucosyltransferase 2-like isoform X2 [Mizuhopecten yessoensis]|uniref:L-Fucosyltransferase n=2 Tax=Mizuhopecten yessoensis TaxID=6573 RepID=A0A210PUE6_MIZYE|nr:galactoside 2-alpha-L-fucosyltransferase 2-like isoform X2 [Mizuhopecten yessoensis]OWF40074.1 Galactoside 2-alpha-L-fucosyltransferase 2 [Mizuhopecten yessoensis]